MAFIRNADTMIIHRVGKTLFSKDLTGEGARLFGGRWNHKGTRCLYAAESRALALLEYTVNIGIHDIPRALSFTTYEVPENSILSINMATLPGNWRQVPVPASTQDFGTDLLKKSNSLVIKIPSTVISEEWCFLINPDHPDIDLLKIIEIADYAYDVRIKLK